GSNTGVSAQPAMIAIIHTRAQRMRTPDARDIVFCRYVLEMGPARNRLAERIIIARAGEINNWKSMVAACFGIHVRRQSDRTPGILQSRLRQNVAFLKMVDTQTGVDHGD